MTLVVFSAIMRVKTVKLSKYASMVFTHDESVALRAFPRLFGEVSTRSAVLNLTQVCSHEARSIFNEAQSRDCYD